MQSNIETSNELGVPSPSNTHEGETSELSCKSCKRRKAKCDRILPSCTFCERNSETCLYPSTRLKPGPKAGSRNRKRRRSNHGPSIHVEPDDHHRAGDDELSAGSMNKTTEALGSHSQSSNDASNAREHQNGCAILRPSDPDEEPESSESSESFELSESSPISDTRFIRAMSLSAMVHPSHEDVLTPPSTAPSSSHHGFFVQLAGTQNTLMQVCESLGLSIDSLQMLTDSYFENMTAFSLFHQPSFGDKVQAIKNCLHLKALMASMFSFSARFAGPSNTESHPSWEDWGIPSHAQFHQLARGFVTQAIEECDVEPTPICIIQALVLCTFYDLTMGVRGRAWRLLGTCVRIAYEHRLHLIDSLAPRTGSPTTSGLARWSAMEERRRVWWAIWQMDIFASTVRRLPTAIDQETNETHLPVSDDMWFQNKYQRSCPLDPAPLERPKRLSKSGNDSDSAWFIIINSIMRNAQVLARGNLHSALSDLTQGDDDDFHSLKHYFHGSFREKHSRADTKQLALLLKALQQTVALLPPRLSYQGATLRFGSETTSSTTDCSEPCSERQSNSAQHAVFLMTQLARFMIYHHFAFSEILLGTIFSESGSSPPLGWTATPQSEKERLSNSEGLRNCLEASDDIYAILSRSSKSHVQWTNPFLASTVWLAASLQVLRKVFAPSTCDDMSEHKIEVLRDVYRKYTDFWDTPRSLLQNLDSLEERLVRKKTEIAVMEATPTVSCALREQAQKNVSAQGHVEGDAAENFDFAGGAGPDFGDFLTYFPPEPRAVHHNRNGSLPFSSYGHVGRRDWVGGRRDCSDNVITANCPPANLETNPPDGFVGYSEADEELSLFISTLTG